MKYIKAEFKPCPTSTIPDHLGLLSRGLTWAARVGMGALHLETPQATICASIIIGSTITKADHSNLRLHIHLPYSSASAAVRDDQDTRSRREAVLIGREKDDGCGLFLEGDDLGLEDHQRRRQALRPGD